MIEQPAASAGKPAPRRVIVKILVRGLAILFIAAGVALALWLHTRHLQWSAESLRAWISERPLAPLVFIAVIIIRPFLLLPSALVMTVGGALFGVLGGTLLGTIGGSLSGLITFWLARSLGREMAEKYFGPKLRAADSYVSSRGTAAVVAVTAFPATPVSVAQIAFGLSGIPSLPFMVASLIGMLPRTALLAWFGDSLAQAQWLKAITALLLIIVAILIGLHLRSKFAER